VSLSPLPESMLLAMSPPALLVLGAIAIATTRGHARGAVAVLAAALAALAAWHVPDGPAIELRFIGYDIVPVAGSAVQRLFAVTFSLTALLGALFAYRDASRFELSAAFMYAASGVGVCLSGELISAFLYLQLMLMASTALVWSDGAAGGTSAALRYVLMMLLAGLLLKLGIEGIKTETGGAALAPLELGSASTWMLLGALLIHAAAAPVSAWLRDAYTASTPTATLFLSMYTTKSAILLILLLFPGTGVLVAAGLVMVGYAIAYGLAETDVRRLLCTALVAKLGLMLCAIGAGTPMALNGAAAVAVASTLSLTLLFMCAAAALRGAPTQDIGAFRHALVQSRLLRTCAAIGALALSGVPVTAGYVSLPMLTTGVGEWAYWLSPTLIAAHIGIVVFAAAKLLLGSHGTALPSTRDGGLTGNVVVALTAAAALCLLPGLMPGWMRAMLPHAAPYAPYALPRLLVWLAVPLAAIAAFALLRHAIARMRPIPVDSDWLWRVLMFRAAAKSLDALGAARLAAEQVTLHAISAVGAHLRREAADEGRLARPWSAGTAVLWVVAMLTGYALVYYW
jgi:multicomponent Na+:H+ antiporter subunit D